MKSLKAKFRKTDTHEWNKNDERLLAAVEHGEVEKVASLLAKKGASSVKLDSEGKSALHVAATRGLTDCLSVLLAHGADLSVTDGTGFSALHLAAKNNQQECAKKLIQNKCAVDALDSSGKTALHHAAASGNVHIVQLLCEHKSPVNLRDSEGYSPLLLSAKNAHAEVCSILLDWGADVNASDNNGRTCVMLATECGSVSVIEVLFHRGADLWAVDAEGHNVLHYTKLSPSTEVKTLLTSALNKQQQQHTAETKSPRSPQHDQVAKLSDERITTPKKRKAPPPPLSPLQNSGLSSPSYIIPTGTPVSSKSNTPKSFTYKEEEVGGTALREEVLKLQEEKSMLLETIEDLKHIVEQTAGTSPEQDAQTEHSGSAASALVSVLQAKIAALTLENQQLAVILKKRPSLQGSDDLKEDSRPNSMASNSSFHSTQDDFDSLPHVPPTSQAPPPTKQAEEEVSRVSGSVSLRQEDGDEEEESGGAQDASKEEIGLLRQALESVQTKLLESRKENRSLQAQLKPGAVSERGREREEEESGRERRREEELLESLAELQAKLTETQERYHQAVEEVQELRTQVGRRGSDGAEKPQAPKRRSSLEREVKQLKAQLVQSGSEQEQAAQRIKRLEEGLRRAEEERGTVKGKEQERKAAQIEELYKEAQEEIRMLQEALRGTITVERAAKDFEEMKAEMNEQIAGLQRRLLELSHSYSDTKKQLTEASRAGSCASTPSPTSPCSPSSSPSSEQQQLQVLKSRVEELQTQLGDAEKRNTDSRQEITLLRQEAEAQTRDSVALGDHTQVVSSLGSAIKELESQSEGLKQQLSQKTLQVDALQKRLTAEKDATPDHSVSRAEHDSMRQGLEGEANRLTQLLQGALRKQDEMALEAAAAWQEVRESRAEREALQEAVMSREKENQSLSSRLAEALDGVSQLKQLVENHVSSEREKNKRIDDLSREVGKLKDALNSLSQLSYSSSTAAKRQQQSQQMETLQQQVKQLQYQLAESKKQHHEIVSVYRMHLLYAVQGQMDEDVQKALKQILMMCKMPSPAKESC